MMDMTAIAEAEHKQGIPFIEVFTHSQTEDEFEHFQDEEEFEGFESVSPSRGSSNEQPKITIANVSVVHTAVFCF